MEEIIPYLQSLYKKHDLDMIVAELKTFVSTLPKPKPLSFTTKWYKGTILYTLYPDSIDLGKTTPLENLKAFLPSIRELGCNAVHILPFLASPMHDKGFDVSNYYQVREGLGGLEQLREVKKVAHKLGLHVFMDLIFNHVSSEHEWFVKAQQGDEFYRDFFIYTKETPQFLGKVYKNATVYAEYLINGEKNLVSVAFPEFAGELPHWTKGKDGYWYYHTYYPSQIDLNWKNPHVFLEMAKVLLYWTSFGFNFRLDAIPFVGKSAYKHLNTHNVFTHHLTSVFPILAKEFNPQCVFILETYEKLDSEIEYFGTENIHQAHMLYSFHITSALWVALARKDISNLWRQLQKNRDIPAHGQWINFLRSHDELSFAYIRNGDLEKVHKKLLPFGKAFNNGYGIAGRTYSLLGSLEKRFLMAYFLLVSLPGSIMIPYGDEFGIDNIPVVDLSKEEQEDVRNINRGNITKKIVDSTKSRRIFAHLKIMFSMRELLQDYLNVWPEAIPIDKDVFAATYKLGTSELVVFINITKSHKNIPFDISSFQEVASVNTFEFTKQGIELGPYGGVWLQK